MADGRLVTASATENADLFWGLRGGGHFGIATSFQFRLHPVSRVLAGMLVHPIERSSEVLRLYREVVATAPDALCVHTPMMTTPEGAKVIALIVCYDGPVAEGEAAIARLRGFAPALAGTVQPMAYVELQRRLNIHLLECGDQEKCSSRAMSRVALFGGEVERHDWPVALFRGHSLPARHYSIASH